MLLPIVSPASIAASFRRFRRNRHGSAAVEFALVAPIFFALIFAIIETSLVFFAGQVLETGNQDTARLILTSQVKTQADYKQYLCDRISVLMTCANVDIDVRSYPAGTAFTIKDPIVAGVYTPNFVYQLPTPGSSETTVARAFYQWPLIVTQLGYNIANIFNGTPTGNKRLLASTAAVRQQ
jgi:Flp pilus assembly protein TadG